MGTETKRQRQVAEVVKRNISLILQQEGRYIYGTEALVTVTNVKMTPDFGLAKIYLSIYNTENKQEVMLMLEEEHQHVKQQLASRIRKHVRRVPNIAFFMDDTLDEMYRLRGIFDRLHEEKQMGDETNSPEEQH